jgi:hypothetical protein
MTQITRSYRGISKRLAIHYLEGLGGEALGADGQQVDDAGADPEAAARVERVVAEEWHVTLRTEPVSIGPSLTLTEITVVFEGDADKLEELVERFSQKAMRAGG